MMNIDPPPHASVSYYAAAPTQAIELVRNLMSSSPPPLKRAKLQPGRTTHTTEAGMTADSGKASVTAAVAATISDESLKYRLAMGAATSKGGRGSLAKCAVRLLQLNALSPDDASVPDSTSLEGTKEKTIRELQLLRIEMKKMYQILMRIQHETLTMASTEEQVAVGEPVPPVADLRQELSVARQALSCQHEYEALAKLITNRHGTSRMHLQGQADALDRDIQSALTDRAQKHAQLRIRTSQCQWMLQSIMDLKQSLSEPASSYSGSASTLEPTDDTSSLPQNNAQNGHKEISMTEVDESENCAEDEKDDEALYGDL